MKNARIAGLRLSRIGEWLAVLRSEGRRAGAGGWGSIAWHLAAAALSIGVTRRKWMGRIMTCHRCPIYDRGSRACRNGDLGCGCYCPLKAMAKGPCWIRERTGSDTVGWP